MIKPLDENVDYLYDFDISKDFLNRKPKVLTIKGKKCDELFFIKMKNFCFSKVIIKKIKGDVGFQPRWRCK